MTPRPKRPLSGAERPWPTLAMASTSASTWRARAATSDPASVTVTDCVVRSNSVTPRSCSSFLIWVLSVDWPMLHAAAARPKWP